MPGNSDPIFSKVGDVSRDNGTTMPLHVVTATADFTGASANHELVHTAGTNGSFVQKLLAKAEGTNTASVLRIYLNNGSTNTTAANNTFVKEVSLPATTLINTAATVEMEIPLNIALNPSFRIYVGVGTTVAAGWRVTAIAGQY
jgi:hypothetical protein